MTPRSSPFFVYDVEHVLEGQWFEVEAVRGVVVRRDGLGVAVDHHRLDTRLAERERRVDAAIVELDALPDAVRAAAQDDDLLAVRRESLGVRLVGRVQVGRVCRKLCGARVDSAERAGHAERLPAGAHA
jgi:hypothetical protein